MVAINMSSTSSTALSSSSSSSNNKPFSTWCEIFDPHSKFVDNCNRILLFVGLLCLYLDSCFAYLPIVNDSEPTSLDMQLGIYVSFFRLIGDSIMLFGVIIKFRTAYEEGAPHVFGKRYLVKEPRKIAIKYLKSCFFLDLLASLPLVQVYLGYQILASKTSEATRLFYDLILIVAVQFYAKFIVAVITYRKIEKVGGFAIRNLWSGTLYILFVYGSLSHYLGAVYYLLYIDELLGCKAIKLQEEATTTTDVLDQVVPTCFRNGTEYTGLISNAFANKIGSRSFTQKFMFCFSWGLKTLSSMGQNLGSTAIIEDTSFNLLVIIMSLLLFADLIARMQTCMQSVGEQEEQQMVRQRELEEWSKFHQLPPCLRKRVQQTLQSQFHATRDIDNEAILDSLPMDLRCEIRSHLYSGLIRELPIFEEMDDQSLHAICGHLRIFSGAEGMFIVLEGDPVRQMLFVYSGQLQTFSIDGGPASCLIVGPGGVCGQELLAWSSLSTSFRDLPPSARTVRCLTDVEAFSLSANDLKLLQILFNYDGRFFDALLHHSP